MDRTSSPSTYSRSESNSVPWPAHQHRGPAVELPQPGQLAGQVPARGERRAARAPATATRQRACRAASPSGPTLRTVTRSGQRGRRAASARSVVTDPPPLARPARRAGGAASAAPARRRPGVAEHAAHAARGRGSPRSACTAAGSPSRTAASARRATRSAAAAAASATSTATSSGDAHRPAERRRPPGARARRAPRRGRRAAPPARSAPASRTARSPAATGLSGGPARWPARRPARRRRSTPSSSASGRSCTRWRSVGPGERLDVVRRDVVAPGQPRPRAAAPAARSRRAARRPAPGRRGCGWPGRRRRRSRAPRVRPRPGATAPRGRRQVGGAGDRRAPRPRPGRAGRSRRRAGQHLDLVLARRQRHRQLEQEAVELGLGQRVGALVLDRVLGGGDQERVGQRPRAARRRVTCRSSIASSSEACVFGGVRLISSASSRLVKTGPSRKENSRACGRRRPASR